MSPLLEAGKQMGELNEAARKIEESVQRFVGGPKPWDGAIERGIAQGYIIPLGTDVKKVVLEAQTQAFAETEARIFARVVEELKAAPKRQTVMVDGEECYVFPVRGQANG